MMNNMLPVKIAMDLALKNLHHHRDAGTWNDGAWDDDDSSKDKSHGIVRWVSLGLSLVALVFALYTLHNVQARQQERAQNLQSRYEELKSRYKELGNQYEVFEESMSDPQLVYDGEYVDLVPDKPQIETESAQTEPGRVQIRRISENEYTTGTAVSVEVNSGTHTVNCARMVYNGNQVELYFVDNELVGVSPAAYNEGALSDDEGIHTATLRDVLTEYKRQIAALDDAR